MRRPLRPFLMSGVGGLAQKRDHPQFLQERGIEGDLVEAVHDLLGGARRARALDRIDRHDQRVLRGAFAHERRHGRVAGIAAIPIGLAVDLDRLEQRRQAGRGEEDVRA